MKNLLKGVAIMVVTIVVLIVINMIFNINGHELDPILTGATTPALALLIYGGLTKNEKNKDN